MEPTASVIMPCFDVEQYVGDAVGSILSQPFGDFELIAVDDGSGDGTAEILDRLAAGDGRIRVIRRPHRGVSAARNAALDAARGKYVFFIDPDDTARPGMLEKGVAEMERSGADYCMFAYRRRFGNGPWHEMPLCGDYRYASNDAIVAGLFPRMFGYSNDQAKIWMKRGNLQLGREEGGVWRCVYRRDIIERAHVRFDESIVLYEDAMFNCEYMLAAESMTCLDEPLYEYTVRPHGAVTANARSQAMFANKRRLLEKRKELDLKTGGRLTPYYRASCVFSLMEMARALFVPGVRKAAALREMREYAADPVVRAAFAGFPLSLRRPLASLLAAAGKIAFAGTQPLLRSSSSLR